MLIAVLHFIPDPDHPHAIVARLLAALPPGVVPISEWNLGTAMDTTVGGLVGYAGIGRKP